MKRFALFAMFSIGLLHGCGRGLDKDADPDEGRKALQTALEAWKDGKLPEELERMTPPIIMNEDVWRSGAGLLDFKVEGIAIAGRQVRAEVRIKLKDKNGKTQDQRATYIIDTTPRIVIVRDIFSS